MLEEMGTTTKAEEAAGNGEVFILPVSFAQQRLWFLSRLYPASSAYNIFNAFQLSGELRIDALAQSLREVVRRHETLRTTFFLMDGEPVQVVSPEPAAASLPLIDLQGIEPGRQRRELEARLLDLARLPFDLTSGPLLKLTLFRLAPREHALFYSMHHTISDGWSEDVFFREMLTFYRSFAAGAAADLDELPLQYGDYAHWQRELLQGEVLEEHLTYWRRQLEGVTGSLDLPTDKPRPAVFSQRGDRCTFSLSREVTRGLRELGQREDATLFMILLAAFGTLLGRHAGQEEVLIGSPVMNRDQIELEGLIGLFLNTLVLRVDLKDDPSFPTVMSRVREMVYGAQDHRNLPFEKLVTDLRWERDQSRNPFFQAFFNLEIAMPGAVDFSGLDLSPIKIETNTAKFDLLLNMQDDGKELRGSLEYCTDLFEASTIERMLGHFCTMLEQIVREPSTRFSDLPLLTAGEEEQILREWNQTQRDDFPLDLCLHELVARGVETWGEEVAVRGEGVEWTYRELDLLSDRLAWRLAAAGVGPDILAGIYLKGSSPAVLVAILGVLKAGGAYVPIDPAYPSERISFLLDDARIQVVVTSEDLRQALAHERVRALCVEEAFQETVGDGGSPKSGVGPENLAYVIYTSGSTGRPKGVMVPHRGVVNYLSWCSEAYRVAAGSGAPVHSSLGFDLTVTSLLAPLLCGRVVTFLRDDSGAEGLSAALVERQRFSLVKLTPAHLELVSRRVPPEHVAEAAQILILGGETLLATSLAFWRRNAPATTLVNEYGPTETVVGCCVHTVGELAASGDVPIGRPIANTRIYLLDVTQQPVPVGVTGELCVGGAQVARGYLQRPDLTAAKFIPDPWSREPGARLYRTGDLARYGSDGVLRLLGRMDGQVKVHGYRIEPGEIEAVLVQHEAVQEAVVSPRHLGGETRLVAYVVPAGEAPPVEALRAFLLRHLPEHMVPSAFVTLDHLPLNLNGKVDRAALPAPGPARPRMEQEYVAPRNVAEDTLASIWSRVLGVDQIGIYDNFFSLGGDSIRSIQVVALAREGGMNLSLQQIAQCPTIAALALELGQEKAGEEFLRTEPFSLISAEDRARLPEDVEDAYPLTHMQAGMIFHIEENPDAPVFHSINSYHLRLAFEPELLQKAVLHIAARHANLRTSFDLGRYSEPLQLVHREPHFPVGITDLRHLSAAEQKLHLEEYWERELVRSFDLSRAPQLHFQVHRRSDESFQFTLTENHACIDGWSLHTTYKELLTCYFALLTGGELPALPPLETTFRDFVALERRAVASSESREFWDRKLSDCSVLKVPRWPGHRRNPAQRRVKRFDIRLPDDLTAALRRLARQEAVPLKSLLLAVHTEVMGFLANQPDALTSVSSNGRLETADGHLIGGLYLNTLPVRLSLPGGTWGELVRKMNESEIEMLPHRRYPIAEIQRRWGQETLLETSFVYLHFHVLEDLVREKNLESVDAGIFIEETNFPIMTTFQTSYTSSALVFNLDCDRDVMSDAQIDALRDYYLRTLHEIATNPHGRYDEFSPLSEAEKHLVLTEWNDSARVACRYRQVHELFEEQAARTPDRVCAVQEDQELTCSELNRQANRLAWRLMQAGIGPEAKVAICAERSLDMLVGLLAVLKAGGAYVPLDLSLPQKHLDFLLQDSGAEAVLIQERWREKIAGCALPLLCLDAAGSLDGTDRQADSDPGIRVDLDHLVYVIYTSGSTGRPKGVEVGHRQLASYLAAVQKGLALPVGGTYGLVSTFAADLGNTMIFAALCLGGRLAIATDAQAKDPEQIADFFTRHPVDCLKIVPSHLSALLESSRPERVLPGSCLILGGEALDGTLVEKVRALAPRCRVFNEYGPTETTVAVAAEEATAKYEPGSPGTVPVGRPLGGSSLFVLDACLRPIPPGTVGELYIGGASLARGYLGHPDQTAEKFIPSLFGGEPGSRLYRSGDLARHLPDGRIEFLGRVDHQVKIRGFRVELGEIESTLRRHPGVRDVVAVARREGSGDWIVAYAVVDGGPAVEAELRRFAVQNLPAHMVPGAFVCLDALPLTPNGKVNRRALPAPGATRQSRQLVKPRNALELQLVHLWEEILGVQPIGVEDDFFELGGNSLSAVRLVALIRKRLERNLLLSTLATAKTISALALAMQPGEAAPQHLVPIQPHGARPPLYCIHPGHGTIVCYLDLAYHLGQDQPFYGVQALDVDHNRDPYISIEEMATRYVHALREFQPEGPYYLSGWSFGGLVAFEMARQLVCQGAEVARLLLLDCSVPAISEEMSRIDASLMRAFLLVVHAREVAQFAGKEPTRLTPYDIAGLPPDEQMELLLDDLVQREAIPLDVDRDMLRRYFEVRMARIEAMNRYVPKHYAGQLTLFRTVELNQDILLKEVRDIYEKATLGDPAYGWREIVRGPVEIREVPGHHESMIREPHVRFLAEEIRACLDAGTVTTAVEPQVLLGVEP
ncbi:MAG TPA: amino acid adenylation domain-containing protein [Thermoanaerobaculia bacterium]|nr:amino acid adenylation domain-containing protein [Thermoanaerobaculia bacterium]